MTTEPPGSPLLELVRGEVEIARAELVRKGLRAGIGVGRPQMRRALPAPQHTVERMRDDLAAIRDAAER